MGKLWLISGANSSGKSRYAESLAAQYGPDRFYIATMIEQSADDTVRIEKHRTQRSPLAFHTLELPYEVGTAPVTPESIVLLEDVSNLLCNVIFDKGGSAVKVLTDIRQLQKRCSGLIAVTISGLNEGEYEGETADYIRALHWLNCQLFESADGAAQMKDGTPVWQKGEFHAIF